MNKSILFWSASALILFLLSLVWFRSGLHRQNQFFTYWLCLGVLLQIIAAWWLAGARPAWVLRVRDGIDWISYALALAAVALAILRRTSEANRTLLMGLGALLALDLVGRILESRSGPLAAGIQAWVRNVSYVGPVSYLLIVFSGVRLDRLPLLAGWIQGSGFRVQQVLGHARAFLTLNS